METLQISLFDDEDVKLHEDLLFAQLSYSKRYNLNKLPSGKYTLVIEHDSFIETQPIVVSRDDVEVMRDKALTVYKPVLRKNGHFIDLDMLLLSDAKVLIKIVDSDGKVNFTELTENQNLIQKRYNIEQLEKGTYKLTVSWRQGSADHKISQPFRID